MLWVEHSSIMDSLRVLWFFWMLSACLAQDFGNIFNQSGVIVNLLNDGHAKDYDQRATQNLDEQKWYIGGKRVKGDEFKLETNEGVSYDDNRDIIYEIQVPQQSQFYITHVSCLVEQSSSIGRAYITDGGIGKNFMTLIIEGRRTKYLFYRMYLFGRNFS